MFGRPRTTSSPASRYPCRRPLRPAALLLASACQTGATPVPPGASFIDVLGRELVTMNAVSLCQIRGLRSGSAQEVFSGSHRSHVFGVDATVPLAGEVVEDQAVRNWPHDELIDNSVGVSASTVEPEAPVSIREVPCRPDPARPKFRFERSNWTALVNLRPQSRLPRQGNAIDVATRSPALIVHPAPPALLCSLLAVVYRTFGRHGTNSILPRMQLSVRGATTNA
jgi:hypothetical protein